jgi:RNA polymerase subunit RPABC4/transcription elongation factor Spt4
VFLHLSERLQHPRVLSKIQGHLLKSSPTSQPATTLRSPGSGLLVISPVYQTSDFGISHGTMSVSTPITACNFMIELNPFYENLQASSLESLQCPRCSRYVTGKHGICCSCHENAYQWRHLSVIRNTMSFKVAARRIQRPKKEYKGGSTMMKRGLCGAIPGVNQINPVIPSYRRAITAPNPSKWQKIVKIPV